MYHSTAIILCTFCSDSTTLIDWFLSVLLRYLTIKTPRYHYISLTFFRLGIKKVTFYFNLTLMNLTDVYRLFSAIFYAPI